jgi:hypothetical protein
VTSPGDRPPGDRGREAEALAERYLAGLGYRTLARNHAAVGHLSQKASIH